MWTLYLLSLLACSAESAVNGFNGNTEGCTGQSHHNYYYLLNPVWPSHSPAPFNFSLDYDQSGPYLTFGFTAYYLPSNSRYVVCFGNCFLDDTSLIHMNVCSNVDAGLMRVLPAAMRWAHLPNAVDINKAQEPVNTANVQAGYWSVQPSGCEFATYIGKFPLHALVSCPSLLGGASSPIELVQSGSGKTIVRGVLTISNIAPKSSDGSEHQGYDYKQWQVPFSLNTSPLSPSTARSTAFTTSVQAVTAMVSPLDLTIYLVLLVTVAFDPSPSTLDFISVYGQQLETGDALAFEFYPENSNVTWTAGTTPIVENAGRLEFSEPGTYKLFYNLRPEQDMNGNYDAYYSFSYLDPATSADVTFTVEVMMGLIDGGSASASGSFDSQLVITDASFEPLLASEVLYAPAALCAVDSVLVDDEYTGVYSLSVESVYLCQDTIDTPFLYDGVTNFGCLDQLSRVVLVSEGAPVSGPYAFMYGNISVRAGTPSEGESAACFSINPQLIDPVTGEQYKVTSEIYIQVEGAVAFLDSPAKRSAEVGTSAGTIYTTSYAVLTVAPVNSFPSSASCLYLFSFLNLAAFEFTLLIFLI